MKISRHKHQKLLSKLYGFKPPWIGVDLDGTLASSVGWSGYTYVGAPVQAMVARVKKWQKQGKTVKIFSSRVEAGTKAIEAIQDWTEKHGMGRMEVTNIKDSGLVEIWDDLSVRVLENKGRTCCKYRGNWKTRAIYGK